MDYAIRKDMVMNKQKELQDRLKQLTIEFYIAFSELQKVVHDTAVYKKQWKDIGFKEVIQHIHDEVDELKNEFEGRQIESKVIHGFSSREEEAADIVIMVMSLAAHYGLDLAGAIVQKMAYNITRKR